MNDRSASGAAFNFLFFRNHLGHLGSHFSIVKNTFCFLNLTMGQFYSKFRWCCSVLFYCLLLVLIKSKVVVIFLLVFVFSFFFNVRSLTYICLAFLECDVGEPCLGDGSVGFLIVLSILGSHLF